MGKSLDNRIAFAAVQEKLVKIIGETLCPKLTSEPAFRIEGNALIINVDNYTLKRLKARETGMLPSNECDIKETDFNLTSKENDNDCK